MLLSWAGRKNYTAHQSGGSVGSFYLGKRLHGLSFVHWWMLYLLWGCIWLLIRRHTCASKDRGNFWASNFLLYNNSVRSVQRKVGPRFAFSEAVRWLPPARSYVVHNVSMVSFGDLSFSVLLLPATLHMFIVLFLTLPGDHYRFGGDMPASISLFEADVSAPHRLFAVLQPLFSTLLTFLSISGAGSVSSYNITGFIFPAYRTAAQIYNTHLGSQGQLLPSFLWQLIPISNASIAKTLFGKRNKTLV